MHRQVENCVSQGATLVTGGKIPEGPGFYYPPTVLKDIPSEMPAMREEIFGPVIALITAYDEADAIRIANDSEYGLSAAIFTRDIARGEAIAANQIDAGSCFVNDLVSSDPRLPFGGHQPLRFWPGTGRGRNPRVHQYQNNLHISAIPAGNKTDLSR